MFPKYWCNFIYLHLQSRKHFNVLLCLCQLPVGLKGYRWRCLPVFVSRILFAAAHMFFSHVFFVNNKNVLTPNFILPTRQLKQKYSNTMPEQNTLNFSNNQWKQNIATITEFLAFKINTIGLFYKGKTWSSFEWANGI